MARRRRAPLSVLLNGRRVGTLNRQSSGAIDFAYDAEWLAWEHALPVSLSMPLRETRYIGAPVRAVFDNLLPDNDRIRKRVAERTGAASTDAFDLLGAIGRDCVGALQFLSEETAPEPAGTIKGYPLSETEIAETLRNLARAPLGLGDDQDFRISIAGAQEKTAFLAHRGQWMKPVGTTATTHILKPQIGQLPNGLDLSNSVENEHFCLRLMNALGVPSAATEIVDFAGTRVLAIERFDRLWTEDGRLLRVPQEDCCQALSIPPTQKYDAEGGPGIVDILKLLQGSDDPDEDRARFLKSQVAFWLIGATDGHAKNFSVFLSPGGRFRLTPLYDVLSAEPSFQSGQIRRNKMKLAMAVGTNRHYVLDEIVPRHFRQSAKTAGMGLKAVDRIFEELAAALPTALEMVDASLPPDFPASIPDAIGSAVLPRLKALVHVAGA